MYGWAPCSAPRRAAGRASSRHAGELLAWVGLQDKAGLLPIQLSLGEQKRLELAVALGTSPRLLLLDELSGGLAPRDREQVYGAARSFDRGPTVIAIEHALGGSPSARTGRPL